MIPSWVLLAVIIIGGIAIVLANSYYPIAKEREATTRLAQDAKSILLAEVRTNLTVLTAMQDAMKEQRIRDAQFSVSAWETVSRGGLLLGLKPDEITKFLTAYNQVYRANALEARIIDTLVGVESSMSNADETRQKFIGELQSLLTSLEPRLKDLAQQA
jgi:hypothetical protein